MDEQWMQQALLEGKKGHPSPNPHVGAVVVKNDQLLGIGHHVRAGEEHAEVMALKQAGEHAKGATLYVTLEPCNHQGRTGPCTHAIVKAEIKRVVIGYRDPDPNVEGGGLEYLHDRGIEVTTGVLETQARKLILPWIKFVTTGIPYVTLKLALSLDGRIATRTGESKWITGKLARAKVHAIRARHDVVSIGIGTALADDPRLTVRESPGLDPIRMVFDTHLRIPLSQKLVETATEIPTWIICGMDADNEKEDRLSTLGVDIIRAQTSSEGRIDVHDALRQLAERGVVTLMVEGGAELAGSFLASKLADDLHAFVAPLLLGPRGRPGAVDWAGPDEPQHAPRILHPVWELCDEDAYIHGTIAYPDI